MTGLKIWVRAAIAAQALVLMSLLTTASRGQQPADPASKPAAKPAVTHRVMEGYPNRVQARLEQRARALQRVQTTPGGSGLRLINQISQRWNTGQTVTVAFKGGNKQLHADIEAIANEWTQHANLKLDFGKNAAGNYREWKQSDMAFAANIRVSFDQEGYWSLVGTDSDDPVLTAPGEASLNLSGFDAAQRPSEFKEVVLHEFGHALAFEHEHQAPLGECDFRFNDDLGYVATTDQFGQFVPDTMGRRPGLYTVLGGPPNNWPKSVVDFNLRPLAVSSEAYIATPFDKDSIMKYQFPEWMFASGALSQCFTATPNAELSNGDKVGAAKVYPRAPAQIKAATDIKVNALETVVRTKDLAPRTAKQFQLKLDAIKPK
jgi:hypothetical protein